MELGFDELDDLSLIPMSSSSNTTACLLAPRNLGPMLELEWLRMEGLSHLPGLSEMKASKRLRMVDAVCSRGAPTARVRDATGHAEIIRSVWSCPEDHEWWMFCERMQAAAEFSQLKQGVAEQLVAAAREIMSNVFDHSEKPWTGIAAYAGTTTEFEFLIADRGIGVLNSLKSSMEYRSLRDAGEALRAALTDGASRLGALSGHGRGFRPLFKGLCDLSSSLRFRSGDHALTIVARGPRLSQARISQKVQLSGLIVSVLCAK